MQTETRVPNATTFTSSPLRHRLRVELDAPVSEVWTLVGDHTRLPEYSAGIAAVELEDEPRARVCQFRSPDGNGLGPRLREYVRWEAKNVGYASSAEPDNAFGISDTLSLVTVAPASKGTMFTWEEYYVASDLEAARASFEDGLEDMAQRLIAKFGGRIVEHYSDGGR